MKKDRDLLSKSIFIILLLLLVFFSFFKLYNFILNFNNITDTQLIYVDIDKIQIKETKTNEERKNYNTNTVIISSLNMPVLLNSYNYIFKAQKFPIETLNQNSIESIENLNNTLLSNLEDSISYSKDKNLVLAQIQNNSQIEDFEKEAQNLLNSKIKENTPLKIKSFLENVSATQHTNIVNTEKNRYNSNIAFSKYLLNKNAYLNYYYLYDLNVISFKNQENKKLEDDINNKLSSFEKNNKNNINNNIIESSNITKEVINNIETHEKDKFFTFKTINYNNSFPIKNENNKIDFVKINYNIKKKNKKNIIMNLCRDYNYTVTFKKEKNIPDKTEYVQELINNYNYLYEL